jgi:hypothetical protein
MTTLLSKPTLSGLFDRPLAIVAGSVLAVLLLLHLVEVREARVQPTWGPTWGSLVKNELCVNSSGASDTVTCAVGSRPAL